jgi:hypothetical protein
MRQAEDPDFRDFLDRVRTTTCTEDDVAMLLVLTNMYRSMSPSLICIYYRGRFVFAQVASVHKTAINGMEILKFLWEPGNIERLREGLQHV